MKNIPDETVLINKDGKPGVLKRHESWIIVVSFVLGLVFQFLLLNLPIITITTQTSEPYYVTEVSYQPVNGDGGSGQTETPADVVADGYFTVVPAGVILPFRVDSDGAHLAGTFENTIPGSFVIYNSANRIVWEKLGNRGTIDIDLPSGSYRAKFQESTMWGEDVYIYLALTQPASTASTTPQETARYQAVSTLVRKENVVSRQEKVSLWQLITKS